MSCALKQIGNPTTPGANLSRSLAATATSPTPAQGTSGPSANRRRPSGSATSAADHSPLPTVKTAYPPENLRRRPSQPVKASAIGTRLSTSKWAVPASELVKAEDVSVFTKSSIPPAVTTSVQPIIQSNIQTEQPSTSGFLRASSASSTATKAQTAREEYQRARSLLLASSIWARPAKDNDRASQSSMAVQPSVVQTDAGNKKDEGLEQAADVIFDDEPADKSVDKSKGTSLSYGREWLLGFSHNDCMPSNTKLDDECFLKPDAIPQDDRFTHSDTSICAQAGSPFVTRSTGTTPTFPAIEAFGDSTRSSQQVQLSAIGNPTEVEGKPTTETGSTGRLKPGSPSPEILTPQSTGDNASSEETL